MTSEWWVSDGVCVICTTANKLEENSRPGLLVLQQKSCWGSPGKRFRRRQEREAAIFEPAAKGETERVREEKNRNEMKLRLSEPET